MQIARNEQPPQAQQGGKVQRTFRGTKPRRPHSQLPRHSIAQHSTSLPTPPPPRPPNSIVVRRSASH